MESGRMWEYERLGGGGGGGKRGPLVCKAEPLAVIVNKLRERKTVDQKEDIRTTTSDVETERGKSSAPLFRGARLHLCATPGCYRAGVYGRSIPRPPITAQ